MMGVIISEHMRPDQHAQLAILSLYCSHTSDVLYDSIQECSPSTLGAIDEIIEAWFYVYLRPIFTRRK